MRHRTLACFLACVVFASRFAPAAAPPQPPDPESYVGNGQYSEYADKAQAFLRAQPDSPLAPRAAMDLLMTADVMSDTAVFLKMRKLLVSAYPASLPGRWVIGQLKTGEEFATLMADVADDNFENPPAGFAARYVSAVRAGLGRFGRPALGDGPALVRTAVLAAEAGDAQLANTCGGLLKGGGPADAGPLRVLAVVGDSARPPLDRLDLLHALPDRTLAVPFERYLLGKMTDADRESPDALRARADNDLQYGRVSEALPLLEKIPPGGDEARVLFWRAWAWAAAGEPAAASDLFQQLGRKHPDDPWAKQAADLQPVVRDLDPSLARTVEAVLLASKGVRRGTQTLEARAAYTPDKGPPVDVYLGVAAGKQFELRVARGEKVAFAYRSTDKDCTVFLEGEPSVYHFSSPGVLPLPVLNLRRVGNGFAFNAGMNLTTSADALATALSNLMSSEFLSTREGLQDLLRSSERRGEFPLPPAPAGPGETTYGWVSPDVAAPKAARFTFTLSADGTVVGAAAPGFTLRRLRYGPADSFTLAPPAFPGGAVVEKGALDLPFVQKLVPAVMGIFGSAGAIPTTQPDAAGK